MIFLHTQKSITIFSFSGFDLKQRGRTNRVYTLGNEYIKLKKTNILQHGHIYGMINNNTLNSKACERNHTHTQTQALTRFGKCAYVLESRAISFSY